MRHENHLQANIQKLNILSVNDLAARIGFTAEKLVEVANNAATYYKPFPKGAKERPFQQKFSKTRVIDNPLYELKIVQRRVYKKLLLPISFPDHILGAVKHRSVFDNANRHSNSALLVTVDVRQCFPSITNVHVYDVWKRVLGCGEHVAPLLTKLTTFERRLPQGAPTSPLLANLFIWSIDAPIRDECEQRGVVYSTWIDDLAFSGKHSREMIQSTVRILALNGLRLSHKKIRVMGPEDIKLLTGTRLGCGVRAPKEKLSRVRSGIHKLSSGLVPRAQQQKYIEGLVGQLRYIERACSKDSRSCKLELLTNLRDVQISKPSRRFLDSAR